AHLDLVLADLDQADAEAADLVERVAALNEAEEHGLLGRLQARALLLQEELRRRHRQLAANAVQQIPIKEALHARLEDLVVLEDLAGGGEVIALGGMMSSRSLAEAHAIRVSSWG